MRNPWFIALSITVTLVSSMVVPARANELDDFMAKQTEIEKAQDKAKSQIKNLQFTEEQKKQNLKELASQISVAKITLSQKDTAYLEAKTSVEAAEKELLAKQKDLEDRQEALRKRVRGIYEEGNFSYLDILFQAENLSDFITMFEYFEKLIQNDQKLLESIKIEKDKVLQKTEELKEKRDLAEKTRKEAIAAKGVLASKKQEEQNSLAEVTQAQDELFTQISKLEKDSKALEQKIRQLQAGRTGGVVGSVSYWPLPDYHTISSPYGWRIHPITKAKSLHTGTDIPAPNGTPIYAAGTGTVIYSGWYGAYGNTVIVDHGKGLSSMYPHQSKIAVSNGQNLNAGDLVGYVGSTGWSTGPHLHLEVRINGNPTDPLVYFR
ncbi:peptidoglycan DD-metalloendopeptidase family protein [Desulfosporosinus sp.]|uniref:murein hydrolase activator EnvC family protein n=1 Tax=Desulfosporosinus sp. TaxID=157907 RepID=UPI00263A1F5E|nr:peptidoglycan DD-metalloendopeptidase family protein [Desulfosporosinus sp.]